MTGNSKDTLYQKFLNDGLDEDTKAFLGALTEENQALVRALFDAFYDYRTVDRTNDVSMVNVLNPNEDGALHLAIKNLRTALEDSKQQDATGRVVKLIGAIDTTMATEFPLNTKAARQWIARLDIPIDDKGLAK